MEFFFEVLIGGLLAGVMYALVAIGFVLIYKASGVFNFAQGAMVLFAALTFVSLLERGLPFFWAFVATLASMVLLALLIEKAVLRPLVNRPPIILFMATLGLSYLIEGLAQLLWGAQVHGLELGIADEPLEIRGMLLSQFDLFAAARAEGRLEQLVVGQQPQEIVRLARPFLNLQAMQAADALLQPGPLGGRLEVPGAGRVHHQGGEVAGGMAPERNQGEGGDDGDGEQLEGEGDQRDHQRGAAEQRARQHHGFLAPPGEKR